MLGEISEIKGLLNSGFLARGRKAPRHRGPLYRLPEGAPAVRVHPPAHLRRRRRQQPARHRARDPGHRPRLERLRLHHGGERRPRPLPEAARLGQRLPDPLRLLQVHRHPRGPGLRRLGRPLRPRHRRRQPDLRPAPEQALHVPAQGRAAEPARRAHHARAQGHRRPGGLPTRPRRASPSPKGSPARTSRSCAACRTTWPSPWPSSTSSSTTR
ncbi:MAG: hypothetical protein MZV64_11945 [Ignavibacteriales bacterium]|nr:hypothetical protein [Ignavibacteriales bacterium]